VTITIIRPGQKVYHVPGYGISVTEGGVGVATSAYYAIAYNGTTYINGGSAASLDDLPAGAFTVECWATIEKQTGFANVLAKSAYTTRAEGWMLQLICWVSGSDVLSWTEARVFGSTTSRASLPKNWGPVNTWHHIAMTFNAAGDAKTRLWIDGAIAATAANALDGYYSDAAHSFYTGRDVDGTPHEGKIGWTRISNVVRYTEAFTPAAKDAPPESDANTLLLWRLTEGTGTTINDSSANNNDGTLYNGTWLAL